MKIIKITINDFYTEWKTNPQNHNEIDVDVWHNGIRVIWMTYPKVVNGGIQDNAFHWLDDVIKKAKEKIGKVM